MPKRLLYLTPYFPPLARVGALRPLKFIRHLATHGWEAVVVCDLWSGAKVDLDLLSAVPAGTQVERVWSHRAQRAWSRVTHAPPPERRDDRVRSAEPAADPGWVRYLPSWLSNPELIPLGEHGPRMSYNLRAAEKVLDKVSCDAILVNADPYAATLVGAKLSRRHGLPLVVDLRDPWAPCELRRPRRPAPIRALVDRLERGVVERAAAVITNTAKAQADYRAHYSDLPEERFHCIHNHFDRELINGGGQEEFEAFTLLFLGNFGRFIKAEVLLQVLAGARAKGIGAGKLQLLVTGNFSESSWRLAHGLGVQDMVRLHPHVPYRQIGAVMSASDALVLMIQPRGTQRFAAKLFDYLASERPILAISDNPEVARVLARAEAGVALGHGEIDAIVDWVVDQVRAGRRPRREKLVDEFSSQTATAKLASILDAAVAQ